MATEENSRKILLVEDSEFLAENEQKAIESWGYTVEVACTGEDAVKAASGDPEIDLVLMDIYLGDGIDGTEAAQRILEGRDLPIVFLSSHTEKEVVEKTEKISSYGYVLKNAGLAVLYNSINMAFRLHDAHRALEEKDRLDRKKLETLLSPEGDVSSLELGDILDTESIQGLMDDFYRLTEIGVAVIDTKGQILVANGWQDICTKFHRVHPETKKNCIESDTILGAEGEPGTFRIYKCKNNMWDISTPIILGGKHMGSIFLGQFFFEDEEPDYDLFREQARRYGFDEEEYIDALDRAPRWNRETVDKVMSFYSRLAELISRLSYSNLELSRTLEEHKRAEKRIENLLEEKDLFLKEVHHRIKNNLNTIQSLLNLQLKEVDDEGAKGALRDSTGRVRSMMLLYDKLYRSERLEEMSIRDYFRPLTKEIIEVFPNAPTVEVETELDEIVLSPKTLSVLGIIVNELVTNSIKYAFTGTEKGRIVLEVRKIDDCAEFIYRDNGCGLPPGMSFEESSGFGFELIRILVGQLGGTVWIEEKRSEEEGSRFRISFPLESSEPDS